MAMEDGLGPVGKVPVTENTPVPLLARMLTVLSVELVTAMSAMVSPVRSPTATALGEWPTVYFTAGLNVPVPVFMRTLMLLLVEFATTRSGLVSPLKSAAAMAIGPLPPVKYLTWA